MFTDSQIYGTYPFYRDFLAEIDEVWPPEKNSSLRGICARASVGPLTAADLFRQLCDGSKEILACSDDNFWCLLALMVTDAEYVKVSLLALQDFINEFENLDCRNSFQDRSSGPLSWDITRHSESLSLVRISDLDTTPLSEANIENTFCEQYYNVCDQLTHTEKQKKIKRLWRAYFSPQNNNDILPLLKGLYRAYRELHCNEWAHPCGFIAVKFLLLKKIVDLYGCTQQSCISAKKADGIVIDMTNLPKTFFTQRPQWRVVIDLFETISAPFEFWKKSIVVIGVLSGEIKYLTSYPKKNDQEAFFDVAYAMHISKHSLADAVSLSCGIQKNIISKLEEVRSLPRYIHPEISRALGDLAGENPADFLMKTDEYVQLAHIVYIFSLKFCSEENTLVNNFMWGVGYCGSDSAPADYFVREKCERLIALLFIVIAYYQIKAQLPFNLDVWATINQVILDHSALNVGRVIARMHPGYEPLTEVRNYMETIICNESTPISSALAFFNRSAAAKDTDYSLPTADV